MGKVKDKQQPESWKPSIQQDAFISKNKKRKEKRLSKSLTMQKVETGDFIPVKKGSQLPVNKLKNEAKQNGFSPQGMKKESAQLLSTSLPIKSNKKEKNTNIGNSSFASFLPKGKKSVTGILSKSDTPKKNKSDRVTFQDKPVKSKSFIDNEAEVGEEPISCKEVKPYEKKGKIPVKRPAEETSDEGSDNDSVYDAEDYIDREASEGEETDDDSGTDVSGDDSKDVSDENESDENTNTNLSNFNFDDDEDEDSDVDLEDDEDDDDDESDLENPSEEESDDEPVQKTPKKTNSILKLKQEASTPKSKEIKSNTPLKAPSKLEKTVKQETPLQKKSTKQENQETPLKTSVTKDQVQKENKNTAKKAKLEPDVTETKSEKKKSKAKSNIKNESSNKNDNVGFIRNIPEKISEAQIKEIIGKKCSPDNVINVVLTNKRKGSGVRHAYVHLKDAKLLESILNQKFTIGDFSFPVYKAKKENIMKPVAFLPRVPVWASNDSIKQAIDDSIGAGSVTDLELKKEDTRTQTKNVLIYFSTMDAMKKAILQGEFKVKDTNLIVREAREAGIRIPIYRAVITDIPEKTTEALLTKTLESKIGADTVLSIRFSFRKNSFAFVVFKTEEAQKKALELGDTLSLKNDKLKIVAYVPRPSRKRAPANEHTKQKRAEKRRNQENAAAATGDDEIAQPPSPKKLKSELPSKSPKKSKKIKKSIASPAGAVKATKNPLMKEKKKFTPKKESVQQDKVSPVKENIKGKKENVKMKQKKQKTKKAE